MTYQLDLSGKVAIITGSSRGIGRAIAFGYAQAGASVVIASRNEERCRDTAAEITAATGVECAAVRYHAGEWNAADVLLAATLERFGRCDVLVNNAGMSPPYPSLPEVTEALYDKVHQVNARGPFRLSVLVGEHLAAGRGGSIINVSTAGALRPNAEDLPYAMAKAALNALTLGLAGAWAPKVRANVIMPGAFNTDIVNAWTPEMRAGAADANPLGRIGEPQDLVGLAVLLASDAGSYLNGAQILADGGAYRSL